MAETNRYQQWIADLFLPFVRGRVLEVGAGIGTMAKKWVASASELHLIEPAENLYPLLKTNLETNPRIRLYRGTLEEVLSVHSGLTEAAIDTAIMVNVLEHIDEDLHTLVHLHRMLAAGGHLLVFVPAMPCLYGSLDRSVGHFRRYTKESLRSLCCSAGFRIVQLKYFDLLGIAPWWFVGRVLRPNTLRPGMARWYDAVGVPVTRFVEKWFDPPFGKNLVLVARKE